jgi:prephenate dehydrogenase
MRPTPSPSEALAHAPVIVGTGLIGTSVGLALRRRGISAYLSDTDVASAELAASSGAGHRTPPPDRPDVVVVAVPPDQLGATIGGALRQWPAATVTDVGSVKVSPLRDARAAGSDLTRYVGGHPLAGSERSGPAGASAALFDGRPWAVVPHDGSTPAATAVVEHLVRTCGAYVVRLGAVEHDAAVARTSHLPYLLSVLAASGLAASSPALALAGPGLRDTTRVAASDPALWSQILLHNAQPLAAALSEVRGSVDEVLEILAQASPAGTAATGDDPRLAEAAGALGELLSRGRTCAVAIRAATDARVEAAQQPAAGGP